MVRQLVLKTRVRDSVGVRLLCPPPLEVDPAGRGNSLLRSRPSGLVGSSPTASAIKWAYIYKGIRRWMNRRGLLTRN